MKLKKNWKEVLKLIWKKSRGMTCGRHSDYLEKGTLSMVIFYVDNGIVLVSGYKEDRDLFISKIHELFVSSNVQNKPKVTVNGLIGYLQSQPGLLK
jgi:hypothetical protein